MFYAKPNLLQASNNSYIILDPKGEILRDTGYMLEKNGFEVKVLDLINMNLSYGYNPFKYINDKIKVTKKGKIKITKNGYFFDTQIII